MMKGGHGPTKQLEDLKWGAFNHASHAPQLSRATIVCTLDDKIAARPDRTAHALPCSLSGSCNYYNHYSALPVYRWGYSHYYYSIEELA